MNTHRSTDTSAIENQLKGAQACKKFASLLIFGGLLVMVIPTIILVALLDLPGTAAICVLIGVLLFLVGLVLKRAAEHQLKKNVAVRLTRLALEESMDHLEHYDPRGSVKESTIKVGMGYPGYDRVGTQGDHIRGTLHGVAIESADFTLEEKEIYYLRESERPDEPHERYHTVFQGRIILCRHRYNLATPLLLSRFIRLANETKTGHDSFDAAYSTRAGTESDITRVLTPLFRESLLELAGAPGCDQLAIRYDPDGTLTIVIRNQDFFEILDEDTEADITTIKTRFASQMAIISRVLDTLDP